jgi:pilus assembly protein CpaE
VLTDRLHVLSGEEVLTEQIQYTPGAASLLIDTLRHRYNFVVVDAPFTGMSFHRDLLMLGHQRVLVMDPTLAAVRDALRLLALPNGPLHVHRGLLVLNHMNRRGDLTRRQVESALKMPVDVAIPDLPKLLNNAASMGEPATFRGPFHKAILALLGQVVAAVPTEGSDGTARVRAAGWRRLFPLGR